MFGLGLPELIVSFLFFGIIIIPFFINVKLAKSRGKSIALMVLLTFFFSWLVTLILALMPKVDEAQI